MHLFSLKLTPMNYDNLVSISLKFIATNYSSFSEVEHIFIRILTKCQIEMHFQNLQQF